MSDRERNDNCDVTAPLTADTPTNILLNHAHIYSCVICPLLIAMASYTLLAILLVLPALLSICLGATGNCTEDSDCSMTSGLGVCNETGLCECNATLPLDCATISNVSGQCVLEPCYVYVGGDQLCRQGNFSRTTALLLSIFLINFGAANFYIQRYILAAFQIVLGLLLIALQFGSCGASCTRKETTSKLCIVCCIGNSFISLIVFSWWLADLIIFATNTRLDGGSCPLYT